MCWSINTSKHEGKIVLATEDHVHLFRLIKGLDKPECRTKGNREAVTCKKTMYIHETCFIYNDRDYRYQFVCGILLVFIKIV